MAALLRLDRVPEPLRDFYLRTVGDRLMWRQADTAARDLLTASAVAASGLPTAADLMRAPAVTSCSTPRRCRCR
ncbi:MAG: hypothetical protein ACR2HC_00230 [Thermoleophilaceae bacterium]